MKNIAFILAACLISCGTPDTKGLFNEVNDQQSVNVVTTNYCAGRCGSEVAIGNPPNQCYCDSDCSDFGDCCPGFWNDCGCAGRCGKFHPNGCWCDESCVNNEDCCPLKDLFCGRN